MVLALRLDGEGALLLQQELEEGTTCAEQESEVIRDCGERLHQLFPGELVWQQLDNNGTDAGGIQQLRWGRLEEEEQQVFSFSHCLPQSCENDCFGNSFWSPKHPLQDEDTGLTVELQVMFSSTGADIWACCTICVLLLVVAEAVTILAVGMTFVANLLEAELLLLGCCECSVGKLPMSSVSKASIMFGEENGKSVDKSDVVMSTSNV